MLLGDVMSSVRIGAGDDASESSRSQRLSC